MIKTKKFRENNPKQIMLLPPSLSDWLAADHPSYFVSEVVEGFDLSGIYGRYTELRGYFDQTVRAAADAGLVKLKHVAVDGTKVKANASKHRAMSYERMLAEEKRVREEIDRSATGPRPTGRLRSRCRVPEHRTR